MVFKLLHRQRSVIVNGAAYVGRLAVEFFSGHAWSRYYKINAAVIGVQCIVAQAVGEGVHTYGPVAVPSAYYGAFYRFIFQVYYFSFNTYIGVAQYVIVVCGFLWCMGHIIHIGFNAGCYGLR